MYKKGKKQYAHERLCSGHDQFSPVVTKLTGFFFKPFHRDGVQVLRSSLQVEVGRGGGGTQSI